MKMVYKRLRPCMQNRNESQLPLKPPSRIFSKCLKGFADSGKEDFKGGFLVAQYDGVKIMWQSENKMKIPTRQQFAFSVIEPLFLG